MGNQQKRIDALERQKSALALRIAGVPYDQIAQQLGYAGPSGAFKAVDTALRRTLSEPANELRTLEVRRLDAALMAIWPQVKQGNLPAVDRYVKLAQRRADLLGLDAPKRTDITSAGEKLDVLGVKFIDYRTGIAEAPTGSTGDSKPSGEDQSTGDGSPVG